MVRPALFPKSNNFDVIRMILSILVFMAHLNILAGFAIESWVFHLSTFAVDCFFIVSGFLVGWSFLADSSLLPYFYKRFFRIYPLYAVVVIVQLVVQVMLAGDQVGIYVYVKYLVANLMFLNFLSPAVSDLLATSSTNGAINGSLWTIKIEVAFYIFLPLFILLIKRRLIVGVVAAFIFSSLFFFFFKGSPLRLDEQFPAQLRFFLVGLVVVLWGHGFVSRLNVFTAAVVFSVCVVVLVVGSGVWFEVVFYPFVAALLVFSVAYGLPKVRVPVELSYPIYILHSVIQLLLYFGYFEESKAFGVILAVLTVLSLSLLCHYSIEKPFMSLGRALVVRNRANASYS